MSVDIRLPNITAPTERGQLEQIRSYLFQLAEQLRFAMGSMENGSSGSGHAGMIAASAQGKNGTDNPATTFNSIKSLIIKSADIIDAYYEEINRMLKGEYVAKSEFGTFKETTSNDIEANSTSIAQIYENVQEISKTVKGLYNSTIKTEAYIKSGLLEHADNGVPIYGLEIGQRNEIDGVQTFDKFARFTADRLSFYDQNDVEVAYISDYKLFITQAEITASVTLGGYIVDLTDGIAFKWIGGA